MDKMVFTNGVHDISNEIYHGSPGLSRSALMKFKQSPAHYQWHYLDDHEKDEPTTAMILGEAVHTLVLENEKFKERFAIMEKVDGRTKDGKAYKEQFAILSQGKTVIDVETFEQADGMAVSVMNNEWACSLLEDNKIELSVYFTHESTGLQCKVRPDAWLGSIINDLKTTKDASFKAFQSSAYGFGYFLQAGMIKCALKSIGEDLERFNCIAVENKEPYVSAIYTFDDDALDYGVNQFNDLMEKMARCIEKNHFPGYGIQSMSVPKYANYETILEVE